MSFVHVLARHSVMTLEFQDFNSSISAAFWSLAALDFIPYFTDFDVSSSYNMIHLLAFVYLTALARKNKLTVTSFRRMFVVCTL